MTDWYKMNPVDWNEGTDDLTLEQEGAYLRICNAIYIAERPVRNNMFVIAGLLRCSDRKARRLVDDLVKAGKLVIDGDVIVNRRAVDEVSARVRLRADRQSTGSRGGSKSAEKRANQLKDKERTIEFASTKIQPEEIRQEEKREPLTPSDRKRYANPSVILQSEVNALTAQSFASHCEEKGKRLSSQTAEQIAGVLREVRALGGNPTEAVQLAIRRGWVSIEIEYLRNNGFPFKTPAPGAAVDWQGAIDLFRENGTWIHAWGPAPGEKGCRVPAELLREHAA